MINLISARLSQQGWLVMRVSVHPMKNKQSPLMRIALLWPIGLLLSLEPWQDFFRPRCNGEDLHMAYWVVAQTHIGYRRLILLIQYGNVNLWPHVGW